MRTKIQEIGVDLKTEEEALDFIKNGFDDKKTIQIVTLNPEMIYNSHFNNDFKKVLNEAELVIPESVGVQIALSFKKHKIKRFRGVDFAYNILKIANDKKKKVALIGAKEEILEKTTDKLKKDFPDIDIVYTKNGYFKDENEVIYSLKNLKPDLVLTALGSPKQEFFNYKLKELNAITIGVGGGFDYWTGNAPITPEIYQKMGLEWLYRTLKQPERLKRIFPVLPIFLFNSIIDSIKDNQK